MTEDKLVPELRFSGFEGEWKKKKLGNISKITMGQSPKSKWYNKKKIGLPLIQGNADIKNKKTNPKLYTEKVTRTADIGDLILTVRAPVGEIAKSKHNVCIGRGVCFIKSDNSEFIYYNLLKNEKKWERYAQGSTFTAINSESINNFEIYTPIKYEQEKIGNFFLKIDKKIDLQEELIENLEEQKKALMQKIFNQEVRFKDENGEDYPEWEERRLGDFTKVATSNLRLKDLNLKGKTPVYDVSNKVGYIDKKGIDKDYISIIKDGSGVGRVSLLPRGSFFIATMNGIYVDKQNIYFVYLLLKQFNFLKYIVGSGIPHIYYKDYSNEEIELPVIEEQNKIAGFLSLVDKRIDLARKELENYKEFKKGLMQRMFI